jgi:hypothetical protein
LIAPKVPSLPIRLGAGWRLGYQLAWFSKTSMLLLAATTSARSA